MTDQERELCPHGRRNCASCYDHLDKQLARDRWWSGEPGLLLPWYCRDHERGVSGLPPDGLWNGPTACGGTIVGVPEHEREAAEARHRETCRNGCGAQDQATSGWEVVDTTNEVIAGVDHRRRVHPRGRWRRRKQVVRQLAADLGWPGCLEVASDDQIVAGVLAAGVRLRDWRRFEGGGRRHPKVRRADGVLAGGAVLTVNTRAPAASDWHGHREAVSGRVGAGLRPGVGLQRR